MEKLFKKFKEQFKKAAEADAESQIDLTKGMTSGHYLAESDKLDFQKRREKNFIMHF